MNSVATGLSGTRGHITTGSMANWPVMVGDDAGSGVNP